MKNQITLNLKEITMIMINLISVKLFFTYPKRLILNSGNAAWIQIIYVSLIMLGIFYITVFAYKRCGNKSILDLSDKIRSFLIEKNKDLLGVEVEINV